MEQQQANAVTLTMTPEAISAMLSAMYLKDADFRAAFDKDPKAAIAKITGQKMAADAEVVVHRNGDKRWHITLPSQDAMSLLSDREISGVSGGTGGDDFLGLGIIRDILTDCGVFESSGSGSTISEADARNVVTALTDAYTNVFGALVSISRGGSGGTP